MGKNVFDQYIGGRNSDLYRDNGRNILSPNYLPDNLPHRDKEIKQLAAILAPAFKNSTPLNMLMYGKSGTGKTAVALHVKNEIEKKRAELEGRLETCVPINCMYVNCQINNSPYGVLADIANSFEADIVPETGWSIDRVFKKFKKFIEGVNIVILDEVDKLFAKSKSQGNQLLYSLTNVNNETDTGSISLIGISNDITYTSNLEQKVLGRVRGEQLVFQSYDAVQLKDILSERAKLAFNPDAVTQDSLSFCAALGAQHNGDARYALKLLRKAGDIAEHNEAVKVISDHVKQAEMFLGKDAIKEGAEKLSQSQKVLLATIILNKGRTLTTGQVYEEYARLCSSLKVERLTQRRVTDFISELDEAGLVNATLKSMGRGKGRTRTIWLADSVPLEEMVAGILADNDKNSLDSNLCMKLEDLFVKNRIYAATKY